MKKLLLTLFFVLFALPSNALELLMAHNPNCGLCQRFIEEVAIDYDESEQAKYLPLTIINVYEQPQWFIEAYAENRIKHIRATPTFIVWNGRKELARLVGYHNKETFYANLEELFTK